MNRRDAIKQGSVLGFLGGLIGINVVPAKEEINKDKLLEALFKIQGKTVNDALCDKLITEDEAKLIIEFRQNALHAYQLVKLNKNNKEWAKSIIEKANFGDPAMAAYLMAAYEHCTGEWAEKVIERAIFCDSNCAHSISWIADSMVRYCGSSKKWADKIKTKYAEGLNSQTSC